MTEERPSRFKQRREARKLAEQSGEGNELTDQEKGHLEGFERAVDTMIEILNEENDGLSNGSVHVVSVTGERKEEATRQLENKYAIVEDILTHHPDRFSSLKVKFQELKDKSDENGVLLERMGIATRAVVREIEKVKERHSLNGIYSSSGRKRSENLSPTPRLDKKL